MSCQIPPNPLLGKGGFAFPLGKGGTAFSFVKGKFGGILPNLLRCKTRPISLLAILCLMFSLLWAINSSGKVVEKILVIVNDDIITRTELDDRLAKSKEMMRELYNYDEERLSKEVEEARPEILNQMIDELLFTQEAVKKGVQIPDTEVQKYINVLKDQYGSEESFREALEAEGYTLESFKREQKRALLLQELIKQKFGSELDVTDDDVKQFYRENRDQFPARSDSVKLKHIFIRFHTTDADKEKALRRVQYVMNRARGGDDFGELAKEFSDHEITKASGGDMGYFIPGVGKYDFKLEEAASRLSVGEIGEPIEVPGGYEIIKVTHIDEKRVRAQRIHIAVRPDLESEKAAQEKANSILEELKNGVDFVDLAKRYSDDPLAADRGGDWKDILIDSMGPELRNSFESFEEGEISQLVKTPLGIHIFKIVSRQDLTEDEVEQLRQFLQRKRLQEKLDEYSEKLEKEAFIKILAEN
jgi:peptidyl-prolyl cis-trans isomerase SurA